MPGAAHHRPTPEGAVRVAVVQMSRSHVLEENLAKAEADAPGCADAVVPRDRPERITLAPPQRDGVARPHRGRGLLARPTWHRR